MSLYVMTTWLELLMSLLQLWDIITLTESDPSHHKPFHLCYYPDGVRCSYYTSDAVATMYYHFMSMLLLLVFTKLLMPCHYHASAVYGFCCLLFTKLLLTCHYHASALYCYCCHAATAMMLLSYRYWQVATAMLQLPFRVAMLQLINCTTSMLVLPCCC